MADTRSLNSDDSVYVTTFSGGALGRSYQITTIRGTEQATGTFTEEDLWDICCQRSKEGPIPVQTKPEFDR